jgi:hypothetical protein
MTGNKLQVRAFAVLLGFVTIQGAYCKPAHGKPKAEACVAAYEAGQELRKAAKLLRAQEALETCAQQSCGNFVHRECTAWLEQLQQALPSVILSAKDAAGAPLDNVEVSLDGEPLTAALNGAAIALDPGLREFRFNIKGRVEVSQRVNILEGQQNRPIEVRFGTPAAAAASPPDAAPEKTPPPGSSRSPAPYVIGGIGMLGIAGFGVLGAIAKNAHRELQQCLPDCAPTNADRVSTLYAAANVSFGIGILGIGTATILLLTSHGSAQTPTSRPARSKRLQAIDVRQTRGGVLAELRGNF